MNEHGIRSMYIKEMEQGLKRKRNVSGVVKFDWRMKLQWKNKLSMT